MKELRIRRVDEWNFCIEEKNVTGEGKLTKPENVGKEYWVPTRFFSKVEECMKAALRMGIDGTGIEEFLKALVESEKRVLAALERSIADGLIQRADTKVEGHLKISGEAS